MKKLFYDDYIKYLKPLCITRIRIHEDFFKEKIGSGSDLKKMIEEGIVLKYGNRIKVKDEIIKNVETTISDKEIIEFRGLYIEYYEDLLQRQKLDNFFNVNKYSDCIVNLTTMLISNNEIEKSIEIVETYWRALAIWGFREHLIEILEQVYKEKNKLNVESQKVCYQIYLSVLVTRNLKKDKTKIDELLPDLKNVTTTEYDKLFYKYIINRYAKMYELKVEFVELTKLDFENKIFKKKLDENTCILGMNILNHCIFRTENKKKDFECYFRFLDLLISNTPDTLPERLNFRIDFFKLLIMDKANSSYDDLVDKIDAIYSKIVDAEFDPDFINILLRVETGIYLKHNLVDEVINNIPMLLRVSLMVDARNVRISNILFIRFVMRAYDISNDKTINKLQSNLEFFKEIDEEFDSEYEKAINSIISIMVNQEKTHSEFKNKVIANGIEWIEKKILAKK